MQCVYFIVVLSLNSLDIHVHKNFQKFLAFLGHFKKKSHILSKVNCNFFTSDIKKRSWEINFSHILLSMFEFRWKICDTIEMRRWTTVTIFVEESTVTITMFVSRRLWLLWKSRSEGTFSIKPARWRIMMSLFLSFNNNSDHSNELTRLFLVWKIVTRR